MLFSRNHRARAAAKAVARAIRQDEWLVATFHVENGRLEATFHGHHFPDGDYSKAVSLLAADVARRKKQVQSR